MSHRKIVPPCLLSAFAALCVCTVPLLAAAQMASPPQGPAAAGQPPSAAPPLESPTAEPSEELGPKIHLSPAPPGPALQRTAYVHEGFYLRVNVGPGWLWSNVNAKDASAANTSGNGFAFGADVLVGGSPSPGMALGVGALTNTGFGIELKDSAGAVRSQSTQFHFLIGPYFDAFPDYRRGFHLGAEIGLAGAVLDAPLASNAFGGGAAGWVGYDMWVAPEWSAGVQLRGNGAYMLASDAETAAFGLNLMITILQH